MADNINAIEIKGITRNATKIGVQDGQAEDLINLRFQDGSWRASGDGKKVFYMGYHGTGPVPSTPYVGTTYEQLYIHTNVYRHLLGVVNGKLYWFANISADGVFEPLQLPIKLTDVSGQIYICQTGHLITVIDSNSNDENKLFSYFVFKTSKNEYIKANIDTNGKQSDRTLYPFGHVRFNLYSPEVDEYAEENMDYLFLTFSDVVVLGGSGVQLSNETCQNLLITSLGKATEANKFTGGLFAIAAIELYDGSFVYASPPVYLAPREQLNPYKGDNPTIYNIDGEEKVKIDFGDRQNVEAGYMNAIPGSNQPSYGFFYLTNQSLTGNPYNITAGKTDNHPVAMLSAYSGAYKLASRVYGSDLCMSIQNKSILKDNADIFSSVCIFITHQSHIYETDLKKCPNKDTTDRMINHQVTVDTSTSTATGAYAFLPYLSERYNYNYELLHSPFYLLKRYTRDTMSELDASSIIDLSKYEDQGLLKNLPTESKILTVESMSRTSYKPKIQYSYNGRLHIADYLTSPFHGYPLDCFQLSNHSVEVSSGDYFPDNSSNRILPNLKDHEDSYLQYERTRTPLLTADSNVSSSDKTGLISAGCPIALSMTKIETENGSQYAVRYIEASAVSEGVPSFIEDIGPMVTYPDSRAENMEIYIARYDSTYGYYVSHIGLTLKPASSGMFAYFFNESAKPISISTYETIKETVGGVEQTRFFTLTELIAYMNTLKTEANMVESFPNGLKVSKTDNPLYFPVEHTYQIGSGEILAICSNAIAVGTGQTGAAPLYVFCTDGLYALFVDETGEMAYTNSRIIARDVLNNPDSVTPIDTGVAFTTDRGLMLIAGEQVEEIGAPAEGDVEQYANASSPDYNEFIKDRLTKVAELPLTLCDATDFLTYLKDKGASGKAAIINYNHNQRELIVSNPNYPYSYVMDRKGNWSRRDYSADEYVNNYPTSYRVKTGVFYKVDEEGDANTPLEQRKEADNQIFYLSNEIKLGSIGFKQAYRFVVRGYFETLPGKAVGCYLQGSYDGRKWATIGGNEKKSGKFTNIGCHVSHADMRFYRICLAGQVTGKTRIDYMEMSSSPSVLNTKIR